MTAAAPLGLSIVTPTYKRDRVLVETLEALLALDPPADEILVIDQSATHEPATAAALAKLAREGRIRLIALAAPSIPAAMNLGLRLAREPVVLFVDDDVAPAPNLAGQHRAAHAGADVGLVAGRVIQPWDRPDDASNSEITGPRGPCAKWVTEFFGGNFSLDRAAALALGGFDENFAGAAYRFEAEFAHRWRRSGRRIRYEPDAWLRHLKAPAGGTRALSAHARTLRPDHAVGEYYCLLRTWAGWESLVRFVARPIREVSTRRNLRAPWWIPLTLIAEARGMAWAVNLARRGPRLLRA